MLPLNASTRWLLLWTTANSDYGPSATSHDVRSTSALGGEAEMLQAVLRPHRTRIPHSQNGGPEEAELIGLLDRFLPDEAWRRAVLVDNPARLHGFD
jgi:hypothetical protein